MVKSILERKSVIQSTVTVLDSGQYSRTINAGQVVGIVKPSIPVVGGTNTTWMQVITDQSGSLITTYPVPAPK